MWVWQAQYRIYKIYNKLCFSGQATKAGEDVGTVSEEMLLFQTVAVVLKLWSIILQVFICLPQAFNNNWEFNRMNPGDDVAHPDVDIWNKSDESPLIKTSLCPSMVMQLRAD